MKKIALVVGLVMSVVVLTACCNRTCAYKDAQAMPAHHDLKGETR